MSHTSSRRLTRLVAAAALALAGVAAVATATPAAAAPTTVVGGADLGANTILFTPDMAQADIQSELNTIAAQQVGNQFGDARYAIMFAPGTYGSADNPLEFQIGYYEQVMGLGRNPDDTVINGTIDVYNQCDSNGCFALNNFWRSVSNLKINVYSKTQTGCYTGEFWAVSQATSLRRVDINGNGANTTLMDYCTGPSYASGGFIADSRTGNGTLVSGSQQQWLTRNSTIDNWSNGVWNQVFVGVDGAPAEDFQQGADPVSNQYTTVATAPVEKETPYLYLARNKLRVFVPAATTDAHGITWAAGSTPGTSRPISSFYIATPSSSDTAIDAALAQGKNLLFTPGVYSVGKTIHVTNPNTVVLGLGLATLSPTGGRVAMKIDGVPGVTLSGVLFDAGATNSYTLLNLAPSTKINAANPTLVSDVYFRVGGAQLGKVTTAAVVSTSNVVLDNLWVWRADHGNPGTVGWTVNTARTGLQVTGANVTAYGLFVEHFQGTEVYWSGVNGKIFMFQNEMPYDVPSQDAWNLGPQVKGYPAIRVAQSASGFRASGIGSYSNFTEADIHATEAFMLPTNHAAADMHVHDALTVFLNNLGGIDSVINGVGTAVNADYASKPADVIDY